MTPQDPPPGGQNTPGGTPPPPPPPPGGGTPPPPPGGTPPPPGGGTPPPPGGGYPSPPPPPPGGGAPPPPPPGGGYPPPPGGGYPPPPGGQPGPQPGRADVGAGFSWAWAKFQQNAVTLIVSTLILMVLATLAVLVVYIPFFGILFSDSTSTRVEVDPNTGQITSNSFEAGPSFFLLLLIGALVLFIALLVVQGIGSNLTRMGLMIADGQQPGIGELFRFPRGGTTWVTVLLLALGTAVGYILCYLPGILFAWGAAFTFMLFYDRNLSPTEAIKGSFGLFKNHFGAAFVTILLGALVAGAGSLLCGIGVIVTGPLAQLFIVHQYRSITGGRIAA